MANIRTYGDGCSIARGLDLVGERWALLVVRELLLGPKRYTDLRRGLPNVSPNVLSQRLDELEHAGILRRRKLSPPAGAWVYELTDWGLELEPIVLSLGRWAARSRTAASDAPIASADSVILAMRGLFDPAAATGLRATYELRLGEDRFRVQVVNGQIELARGDADQADATIDTDPDTLNAVLLEARPLADAQRSGAIAIDGDKTAVKRLLRLFPGPQPAAAAASPA
jgi:DNA-binding HxlR family transcriptional regulator